MISMQLTPKEVAEYAGTMTSPDPGEAPKYAYGLCLYLNDETLKKLGLGLPEVGTRVVIQALAVFTGGHANEDQEGTEISAELQITDMEVVGEGGKDIASKLYPDQD